MIYLRLLFNISASVHLHSEVSTHFVPPIHLSIHSSTYPSICQSVRLTFIRVGGFFRPLGWSRYRDANPVPTSPLDDKIATAPSGPVYLFIGYLKKNKNYQPNNLPSIHPVYPCINIFPFPSIRSPSSHTLIQTYVNTDIR